MIQIEHRKLKKYRKRLKINQISSRPEKYICNFNGPTVWILV